MKSAGPVLAMAGTFGLLLFVAREKRKKVSAGLSLGLEGKWVAWDGCFRNGEVYRIGVPTLLPEAKKEWEAFYNLLMSSGFKPTAATSQSQGYDEDDWTYFEGLWKGDKFCLEVVPLSVKIEIWVEPENAPAK